MTEARSALPINLVARLLKDPESFEEIDLLDDLQRGSQSRHRSSSTAVGITTAINSMPTALTDKRYLKQRTWWERIPSAHSGSR